jgi:hypothetical protein
MRCASCGGAAHPASGCQYSETYIVCGRCTRSFWNWVKGHTNMMKRVGPKGVKPALKVSFYEAAGAPIRVIFDEILEIPDETFSVIESKDG